MFLSITSAGDPADDLGYVLVKHPQRVHRVDLGWGTATVFFPRADAHLCTAALVVEVDVLGLSASRRFKASGFDLADHINDRAYAASSLLAVALGRVFRSALSGDCKERPELVSTPLPLTIHLPALPARHGGGIGGDHDEQSSPVDLVRAIFEPLGWTVEASAVPLSTAPTKATVGETRGASAPTRATLPETGDASAAGIDWGDSQYVDLTLMGTQTVRTALQQLYLLLPVFDDAKHYWVGEMETDKLLRHGGDWLSHHPKRQWIMERYLAHQRAYVADATVRLLGADDGLPEPSEHSCQPPSLAVERRRAIVDELIARQAWRVIDLGCGEGKLLHELLNDSRFTDIIGADVSPTVLARAERTLGFDRMPDRSRQRIQLIQSSATYRDTRLEGYDAIVCSEVVEHIDSDRLPAFDEAVFGAAASTYILVTTPNREYNTIYGLAEGEVRHPDHRFERSRAEFHREAELVGQKYGYAVAYRDIGPVDPDRGAPTQMAIFSKGSEAVVAEPRRVEKRQ